MVDYQALFDQQRIRALFGSGSLASLFEEKPELRNIRDVVFNVIREMGGTVAPTTRLRSTETLVLLAALGEYVKDARILDVGCGSDSDYVLLSNDFSNRYPPVLAESAQRQGAQVTGIDWRENPSATYDHRVIDVSRDWTAQIGAPYDIVACTALFNAPDSQFCRDDVKTRTLIRQLGETLSPEGVLFTSTPNALGALSEPHGYFRDCGLDVIGSLFPFIFSRKGSE
jgi:2-polyprenyl-3-methyl-5-hydroxy-6-metoxy-1,4-benzoquinol methylase